MNLKKTKMVQGLFVILVMMHHLSQKTSASWVPAKVRQPGLEIFVPIGYLLVSFFFFASGYGLTKSRKTKENYFDGFLIRRLEPILLTFTFTNIIYLWVRFVFGNNVYLPLNPYSWYVYAIMTLYIGYYFIYRKDRKHPLFLMSLVILAYSIICYVQILGDWWINTPPVFLLGIVFAENEEKILEKIDKKRLLYEICFFIIFLVCFIVTEKSGDVYRLIKILFPKSSFTYYWINIPVIILQIIGCSCFSILIYILLQDRKENGTVRFSCPQVIRKTLGFFGAMTLEFYLIHGLFVQFFGPYFFDDRKKHVCYIHNVLLYVIVVFVLSTLAAVSVKKITGIISDFYSVTPMFRKVFKDMLIGLGFVAIGFCLFTAVYSSYRHWLSNDLAGEVSEFRDRKITYADADGTKVSTLVEGNGIYTVVILGSDDDPCPTLDYRPLTERLLSKEINGSGKQLFRTIIIDYPGKGFSEESDKERTTGFFSETIHETLKSLGVKEKVILAADRPSALYAFDYMNKYPEDVSAFVGFNPYFPSLASHYLQGNFKCEEEYAWYLKRLVNYEARHQKLLCATGYVRLQSPVYEELFYGSGLHDDYDIMEDMYIRRYMKPAHVNEDLHLYENTKSLKGYSLPKDMPASLLLADDIRDHDYYDLDWMKEYKKLITNNDLQKISVIEGDPYAVFYNPSIFAKKIENITEFIK
ncbi:MAG: acyltransferase [Lachnospiraceae bacterium]|nr:acyltransferase [Lachnospiraceae bacterium]